MEKLQKGYMKTVDRPTDQFDAFVLDTSGVEVFTKYNARLHEIAKDNRANLTSSQKLTILNQVLPKETEPATTQEETPVIATSMYGRYFRKR